MGTRYGRRAIDGTTEYYDSKASLLEAQRREETATRKKFLGFVGILVGGVLTYVAFLRWGGMEWPKWVRFVGVLLGSGAGAFVFHQLANILWNLIRVGLVLAVVFIVGVMIWRAV